MTQDSTDHYFSHQPGVDSSPKEVSISFAEKKYTFVTDRGVFSYGKVDKATHILLDTFLEKYYGKQPENIADVGSGYGVISCVVANRFVDASIVAVEPNERAQKLTQVNFVNNVGDERIDVRSPEDQALEKKYDLIISNPPIRVGKQELYELLSVWSARLSDSGQMWLVIAKHLGSDTAHKHLEKECGLRVKRIASKKGFRVLRADKIPTDNVVSLPIKP